MTAKPEKPVEPTLADLIAEAQLADEAAQRKLDAIQAAKLEADEAKRLSIAVWDKLYSQLVSLKNEAEGSPSFRESKLGKLLLNARL